MYVINKKYNSNTAYNIFSLFEIRKKQFDYKRFTKCVEKLLDRHEPLRTSFTYSNNTFYQIVHGEVTPNIKYITADGSKQIETLFEEFIRPFDLEIALLFDCQAVDISDDNIYVMIQIHHIICDSISCEVLFSDLFKLYQGKLLESLKIQYKSYSAWINKRDLSKQKKYWMEILSNSIPTAQLPMDYPRPNIRSFEGHTYYDSLDCSIIAAIEEYKKETNTTEYAILLTVLFLTIYKYTRQESINIGTPANGRTHPDTKNMVGMFENNIVIHLETFSEMCFNDMIQVLSAQLVYAFDNREYPYGEIVEELGQKDGSRNPIFDIFFIQEEIKSEQKDNNFTVVNFKKQNKTAKFDLTLQTYTDGMISWEYCTKLFKQDTIIHMSNHFKKLLKDALRYPDVNINQLVVPEDDEIELVLKKFNSSNAKYPREKTVVELFEEQVERTPQNIALIYE